MPKDVDALAVWDAKARTLLGRIDAALAEAAPAAPAEGAPAALAARFSPPGGAAPTDAPKTAAADVQDEQPAADPRLAALASRAMTRTPPPPGEILTLVPRNMGAQPDRIDPWDAYVCRFDRDGDSDDWEPLRATP